MALNTHFGLLKEFVIQHEVPYKAWFYLVRNRKGDKVRLPKAGDDLFFDGYPRSGNTYLVELLHHLFPKLKFSSHLHAVAGMKMALNYGLPTFAIIRNPLDSVSSLFFMKSGPAADPDIKLISRLLNDYQVYFKFLEANQKDIYIISFNTMRADVQNVLVKMASVLGLPMDEITSEKIEAYNTMMKEGDKGKNLRAGSLPSKEREGFKAKVKALISKDPQYPACKELYERLEKAYA